MRAMLKSECGSSLIELAITMPILLLLLLGVLDFGRAYYLQMEVAGAAEAGAVYGSQNIIDSTDIQRLATMNAPNVPGITASSVWGCECSDGTSPVVSCTSTPSCSVNTVYYVTVTASATYKPLFPWPGIPSSTALSSSTTMRSNSPN